MEMVQLSGFEVRGIGSRTSNIDEMELKKSKIGNLWQKYLAEFDSSASATTRLYGVYANYSSDWTGEYDIIIGKVEVAGSSSTESRITIQSGKYLKFSQKGEMASTAMGLWQEIWAFFQKSSGFERLYQTDFEEYAGKDQVAIYIGVKEVI